MNDLNGELPADLLDIIDRVVVEVLAYADGLAADGVMVVGATARDLHHHAMGHQFITAATHDVDLALALESWDAFDNLREAFPSVGSTGIRIRLAGVLVDLLPFGGIEHPAGVATPTLRREAMGVWAMNEVFREALDLALPSGVRVKIPSARGYAATKLGAWLDRSAWHETRDARDIALAIYWYAESGAIEARIFDTDDGQAAYLAESGDVLLASANLLGRDVASLVGTQRLSEFFERWPGDLELLSRELTFVGGSWPTSTNRRLGIIAALTRGLGAHP